MGWISTWRVRTLDADFVALTVTVTPVVEYSIWIDWTDPMLIEPPVSKEVVKYSVPTWMTFACP